MFISHAPFHAQNLEAGRSLKATPALISSPDGDVNAIAVFNGIHLKFCIPTSDAIRVATEIADVAAGQGRAN
ncbi:hypothetical protein [Arthrobacter sp. AL12]|uniref:hypothetical protein n=1 Tax=Arthrobacter sp. AL12 TaxID=3042241 RepID=UPI00249CE7D0|nr:hypothetical protein [Arthrobacter sp. AL12]MDI3211696.1 hypothetical protein [Arthrobacter sp. AL12]